MTEQTATATKPVTHQTVYTAFERMLRLVKEKPYDCHEIPAQEVWDMTQDVIRTTGVSNEELHRTFNCIRKDAQNRLSGDGYGSEGFGTKNLLDSIGRMITEAL